MISDASISALVAWRKETTARLAQIRKEEVVFRETCQASTNAVRQARYKGKDITWEDRAAVFEMLEAIIVGVTHIAKTRSADLELLLGNIDKLAKAELPPGISWEWPSNQETLEH
jgi:hypothetical protein